MRWWRDSQRLGSALAGFAMLLQLVLSFGHLHLHDLTGQSSSAVRSAAAVAGHTLDKQHPTNAPGDEDGCPICTVMHMVSGAALPTAPVILVPGDYSRPHQTAFVRFNVVARRYALFQTRAPPRA
ncbi:MAG TPA: DUF2946 family protein [Xanthobacteraceae bacterium]|jgi:hypothetical protein|nr:DUF2946 family protein [Xanthobacteraceae bacterium]